MDLAWISVAALAVTVTVSCTTAINPGILAIVFAWIIGVYVAPMVGEPIDLAGVVAGFPSKLFLTLAGVTLLFTQAQVNGTLDRVARGAIRLCRGNRGLIPIILFLLTAALSSIGAGSIASAALMAPMAMAVAPRTGIPPFLMAIMVGHGAIAGGMSPFASTGIIANEVMERIGLAGFEWRTFIHNFLANALVAFAGYFAFGGWKLFRPRPAEEAPAASEADGEAENRFLPRHGTTMVLVAALIVCVIGFDMNIGMAAFAGAALLTILRMADEKEAFRKMPWGAIMMVCGVSVLTSLLERTGGIDRITTAIAGVTTPNSIAGASAFVSGVVSVYSSTSGVVLPAFLPAVPELVEKLGGGDPHSIASSIIIGGNLVDMSALSTLGALCIASAPPDTDRKSLFNRLLAWGLSMAVLAALLCWIAFGLF